MDRKMEQKFGIYVFLGLLIGVIFGLSMGARSENLIPWIGGGALAGVFIGWFIAAAVLKKEKEKGKKEDK